MNKPLKTAAALRASDTEFLNRPKLSQTMALRAADRIEFICFEHSGNYQGIGYKEVAAIISNEFAVLDELVECFREMLHSTTEFKEDRILTRSVVPTSLAWKSRALLERIEKGTK